MGGGFELVPGSARHGPVDVALPPPGAWQPLLVRGHLVGWGGRSSEHVTAQAVEAGERLARERRTHLLGRLDHKLRSSVLALQEAARAAAFGRHDSLEAVYREAEDLGRRAAALAAAALDPKEPARAVVLAAVLGGRDLVNQVPGSALVLAPEPLLSDVCSRLLEWMGERGATVAAERVGAWWRVSVQGTRRHLDPPELGEPLLRHLIDVQLGGWLDASRPNDVVIFLPAAKQE